ncbi:MAG TPA: thioredoxin domain-containing protein [Tepidisphaeraceae bacterium]|nr:thioredoxin domain-containing protein [Tepidisphaeraceae bacterium]
MHDPASIELSVPVTGRDHIRDWPDAPLTLLEYGDYECDYCGRAHPVVRALREQFGQRMRFVFRNFPHANIHPHASMAAQAAEAAGAQGKFWEMHDLLYEHQSALGSAELTHYALQAGLELYRFEADMDSQRFARKVAEDHQSGVASGVKRTPTFFINGIRHDGPFDFDTLNNALNAAGI